MVMLSLLVAAGTLAQVMGFGVGGVLSGVVLPIWINWKPLNAEFRPPMLNARLPLASGLSPVMRIQLPSTAPFWAGSVSWTRLGTAPFDPEEIWSR